MVIEFKNVSKVYCNSVEKSRRQAVWNIFFKKKSGPEGDDILGIKDISFSVSKGRPFLILGPPKSGKTTIARLMCGLSQSTLGTVNVEGSARLVTSRNVSATPFMTVLSYLKLFCMCHNAKAEGLQDLCAEILAKLGLDKSAGVEISRVLPEQMKRLNYYTSLMIDSDIYVFDENAKNDASDFGTLCRERIEEILAARTAVFLCKESHHLPFKVEEGLVLSEGNLIYCGKLENVQAAIPRHKAESKIHDNINQNPLSKALRSNEFSEIISVRLTDRHGSEAIWVLDKKGREAVQVTDDIYINVMLNVSLPTVAISAGIDFYTDGILAFGSRQPVIHLDASGSYVARVQIPANLLDERFYIVHVSVSIFRDRERQVLKFREALKFQVTNPSNSFDNTYPMPAMNPGIIKPLLEWDLSKEKESSFK